MLLPLAIVLLGFGIAALLIFTGPKLETRAGEPVAPLVRVVPVELQTVQMRTSTNGTVVPRTESELVPEVDGRVVEISPSLVSGGFFSSGDVLLRIEAVDYEVALEDARAGVTRARSELDNARKAHARSQDLQTRGATSDAQRDDALNRLRGAEAGLRQAQARLTRAIRDLERTAIVAPYDGRVRSERVDVGQFVRRGSSIGTIYAVDYAEVRLPIQDEELKYLELELNSMPVQSGETGVPVVLRARFAGTEHSWQGRVVRTEGELDPTTRMVNLVARVQAPYVSQDDRPPLSVGLFVEAEVLGATYDDLAVLPRSALRDDSRVLTVGPDERLAFRTVTVLRRTADQVFISAGLEAGDRVCVSPLQAAADGMRVRIAGPPADSELAVREQPLEVADE
ncbi:MAG: efflux RND transporter periplasmic adaptor subunit [Pseudomonadota bacterium]